ncbi:MAG TPA: PIG-L family deacetylase [Gemmataceae bacterium]|nr:PIG-L family deacetylase [Gemmataceae bacterium]
MNKPAFAVMCVGLVAAWAILAAPVTAEDAADGPDPKLHIIVFGAHPDDCEIKAGGVAALWAKQGHHVKFVSVTNGDIGHWKMNREELAKRRLGEVKAADKVLGVETQVLPIHDGELEPTLENRRIITRLIREWQADIVLCHRPWDYHPDHRYVGVLVQDAAYMVTVPNFCPETPALKQNPVFMYLSDGFRKPYAFKGDVVVPIDDVYEQKVDALHELESQVYEGGANGSENFVKSVPPASDPAARKEWLRKTGWATRTAGEANRFRDELVKRYGQEKGKAVRNAEAFEICEYGRQPSAEDLTRLFPFGDAKDGGKP